MTEQGSGTRMVVRQRRAARVRALQLLYAFEQKHYEDDERLAVAISADGERDEVLPAAAEELARELYIGFRIERSAVDAVIDARLHNWTLHRLAVVDRGILRLGAYELLYRADVPAKVAINEAIELAKQFGSDAKTAKLVNGVLDKIARDHRDDAKSAAPTGEQAES